MLNPKTPKPHESVLFECVLGVNIKSCKSCGVVVRKFADILESAQIRRYLRVILQFGHRLPPTMHRTYLFVSAKGSNLGIFRPI